MFQVTCSTSEYGLIFYSVCTKQLESLGVEIRPELLCKEVTVKYKFAGRNPLARVQQNIAVGVPLCFDF